MRDTRPLLLESDFPAIARGTPDTLQVNLGYVCNLSCAHCHVNAGPQRVESMAAETVDLVLELLAQGGFSVLDLTGGAPELNPEFRRLVSAATAIGIKVIDRCNLTILFEPGQEGLGQFLAENNAEIVASLPCYLEENVEEQRGKGVYDESIEAIRHLNALGYGETLPLNLVYNPQGPVLPPAQADLQEQYRQELGRRFGIRFNRLLTITNMPISRYLEWLLESGNLEGYMRRLVESFNPQAAEGVMCRSTISVGWGTTSRLRSWARTTMPCWVFGPCMK